MTKSTATQQLSASERDAPIYKTFSELRDHGFSLAPGICVFIAGVHLAALVLGIWLYTAAPSEWMWAGSVWLMAHFLLGSLSTTLYSHRLITHNAVKHVSLPVHLFFNVFGQIFSVQGSVRRWSANHVASRRGSSRQKEWTLTARLGSLIRCNFVVAHNPSLRPSGV